MSAVFYAFLCSSVLLPLAGFATECAPSFVVLAPNRLYVLRAFLPELTNPENLTAEFKGKNHPFLANKPAIDYLKLRLVNLEKNLLFRDPLALPEHQFYVDRDKKNLLQEIEQIERRNYPYHDTLVLAETISNFFTTVRRGSPEPELFLARINSKGFKSLNLKFPDTVLAELKADWAELNDFIGKSNEAAMHSRYRDKFNRFLQVEFDRISYSESADRAVSDYRFVATVGTPIVDYRDYKDVVEKFPIFLAPGEMPVRALVEATLFDLHVAGVIEFGAYIDNAFLSPKQFMRHDFGHMVQTQDIMAQRLIKLPKQERFNILSEIDSLPEPRKRYLAEHALLFALRESQGQGYGRFDLESAIRFVESTFRRTGTHNVSKDEVEWAAKWMFDRLINRPRLKPVSD